MGCIIKQAKRLKKRRRMEGKQRLHTPSRRENGGREPEKRAKGGENGGRKGRQKEGVAVRIAIPKVAGTREPNNFQQVRPRKERSHRFWRGLERATPLPHPCVPLSPFAGRVHRVGQHPLALISWFLHVNFCRPITDGPRHVGSAPQRTLGLGSPLSLACFL